MPIMLKPGMRLLCAVSSAELIVIKAPGHEVDLTIAGVAPVTSANERVEVGDIAEVHRDPVVLGKRYVDDAGTIELLCVKAGVGQPALDGTALWLKEAKPLPASD